MAGISQVRVYISPHFPLIVQFLVRYNRWIKEVKTNFFTGLASIWSNIFTNSNEKTFLFLCLLCIFKFQTLTCRNFRIFYFTSRLTLYKCVVNVSIQRQFLFETGLFGSYVQQKWPFQEPITTELAAFKCSRRAVFKDLFIFRIYFLARTKNIVNVQKSVSKLTELNILTC